ncbi:MAG: GerAB/ArcD/ProY family transporter [Ruminococcus sp.]|jgi:hypothetical protein|nr:GerAB/ArcD/ProY family transporter [Ruminococcus sp.]
MLKRKIGWGQVILLLLCCRAFSLMTFVPMLSDSYAVSTQMTAVSIVCALQLVLCLPLLILSMRFPEKSAAEIAESKNGFFGFLVVAAFLVFFIAEAADSALAFQAFLTDRFFKSVNPYIWLGIFLIICFYCGVLGIEGLARSAAAVFIILAGMIVYMAVTSRNDFDFVNIYAAGDSGVLFSAVVDELAKNGEIVALAFLCKYVPKKFYKAVFGLQIGKIIMIETVLLLIQGVLGDFAALTDYPFLAVGAYAGVNLLQRADAAYLVVWTMTAVLKIALFINLSAGLLGTIFPKMPCRAAACTIIVYAVCVPMLFFGTTLSAAYGAMPFAAAQVILLFCVPLIELIFAGDKGQVRRKLSQNAGNAGDLNA